MAMNGMIATKKRTNEKKAKKIEMPILILFFS